MSRPAKRPPGAVVRQVVAEEAFRAGLLSKQILGRAPKFAGPRRTAMRRIITETGCSRQGLAQVWGCDRRAVEKSMRTV